MAFEAILQQRAVTSGWRRLIMPLSVALHGVALAAGVAHSIWQVEEMPLPAIEVTLSVAPPPPPPPPPPKRSSSHPKTKPVDPKPKVLTAPKETPKAEPEEAKEDDKDDDQGDDNGQEGGVIGGVVGGVVGGTAPPPPKSTGPKFLSAQAGHGLLAINPNIRPYKVNVPEEFMQRGDVYSAVLNICVTAQGAVSSVKILKPSIPVIDLQIPTVVPKWRYHPYLVNGQPTEFCYNVKYTVR